MYITKCHNYDEQKINQEKYEIFQNISIFLKTINILEGPSK